MVFFILTYYALSIVCITHYMCIYFVTFNILPILCISDYTLTRIIYMIYTIYVYRIIKIFYIYILHILYTLLITHYYTLCYKGIFVYLIVDTVIWPSRVR